MSAAFTPPLPWICDTCHSPIADFLSGCILINDRRSREAPEYDPDAPTDDIALDDAGKPIADETAKLQIDAAIAYLNDPGVRFSVHHMHCAPPEDGGAFETYLTTCQAATVEQWAAWVSHLGEKNWLKKRDVIKALRFWCDGHGLKVPDQPPQ